MRQFALLGRSKSLLAVLVTAVVLALVGTTVGYAALNKEVTLSLDGEARTVDSLGSTVSDVLDSQGIEVGEHDVVAPGLDEQVSDGTEISVRFGRPLELSVDGRTSTHWVTATDVQSALAEIGKRFAGADLSASRGAGIDREGMSLEVITPKRLTLKVGASKAVKREVAGLTVADVLDKMKIAHDKNDIVKPRLGRKVQQGDTITVTKIRVDRKKVDGESIGFDTVERSDSSLYEGESETVRDGRVGLRNVVYRLVFRNGELQTRKVVKAEVVREPVDRIVAVGTKERPAPAPTTNFASGSTVWDQLAQCESGGNWAINTGNGYYGGLQFSLSTWRGYGGAGYPHQQSREYQIQIAERVRAATGGYGSWPHCSQQLGLPQ